MAEPKTHCAKCGVEMLTATAQRTGGICMPCKNGAPPEWARRQRWLKHGMDPLADTPWHRSPWGDEILTLCRKLVAGEIGCIEGSRKMVELSENVLVKGSVHENVIFPPNAVRSIERLKAGQGEPGRRRTSPVTGRA